MRVILLILCVILSGCGLKDSGSRTVTFGPDGITVASETVEMDSVQLADIEKEKTRQICFEKKKIRDDKILQMSKDNPFVLALIAQAEAMNNAFTLMATGKQYAPCPSSTNSADVEIADSKMYAEIYGKAFAWLKFATGAWAGVEVFDSIAGSLAGGYMFDASNGGTINMTDSFKSNYFGNNSSSGDVFSPSSETFLMEGE